MAGMSRKGGLFTTKVIVTGRVDGLECAVEGRKSMFSSCRYDVLLDTPGKSDEPRLLASGGFGEALAALKRSAEAGGCVGLLKAVAAELEDPDSRLTRGMKADSLVILAALMHRPLTAQEISDRLRIPESTAMLTILELRSEGMVWRAPEGSDPSRRYHMSEIGKRICDALAEDGVYAAVAESVRAKLGPPRSS